MKALVIYKSRTGFTQKYAEWISNALSCDKADFKGINKINIDDYDLIIYGGRVHAGMIDGLNKVKALLSSKKCRFVVYATGATPIEATDMIETMWKTNFPDNDIPHFYMPSGLCYEKMGFGDKTIMKMLSKMLANKKDKTEDDIGMAEAISKSSDLSSEDYIKPLIQWVNSEFAD